MIEIEFEALNDIAQMMKWEAKNIRDKGRYLKSQTSVGCCILSNYGNRYSGCNFDMEWGTAIHSEPSAITMMINAGKPDEIIESVYIYCEREFFTCCGSCRDWLHHFSGQNTELRVYIDNGDRILLFKLGELIPHYPRR